jgi:Fe-S-cluster containining protein
MAETLFLPEPSGKSVAPSRTLDLAGLARLAMDMADAGVEQASAGAAAGGSPVSCRKGCNACCFHLVPLSPAEAFSIRDTVGGLAVRERRAVLARFRRIKARLKRAAPEGTSLLSDPEAYFKARIPCPFLVRGACAIHPSRPLACREHLVVSPASLCAGLSNHGIRILSLRAWFGENLARLCAALLGRASVRIPLPYALDWAEEHAEDAGKRWTAAALSLALDSPAGYRPADTSALSASPSRRAGVSS